jgi:beta-glucosidase
MPEIGPKDMELIRVGSLLTTLGINYYNGEIVAADASQELGYNRRLIPNAPTNDLGWPVFVPPHYPNGLYDTLCETYNRYREDGLKAISITETGLAFKGSSGDPLDDEPRVNFLRSHLAQLHSAIKSGLPITGLFVWSFCDSFEWQDGYKPESRFGLVHVAANDFKRTPKKSARWYARFMAERSFTE